MKRLYFLIYTYLFLITFPLFSQSLERNIAQRLSDFFENYQTVYANIGQCELDHFVIDHEGKSLHIYANENFGYQPFTEENTQAIYKSIKQILPGPVNYYELTIFTDGQPIENLIPNAFRNKIKKDGSRSYKGLHYKGDAWVENISKPFRPTQGLSNRHIALWQSHGKYYNNAQNLWKWQRPHLFATMEDLYTQSIVIPYLIPMLENAGGIIFTPRERDWQKHEIIVDNDTCLTNSLYIEVNDKKHRWETSPMQGFAQKFTQYPDKHNPFKDGTARYITTQPKPEKAFAEWIPNIPEKGKYAVYVSYQTLPESVSDAKYIVFHNGGVTEFKVNQQIGGGTWVYLGTFEFDEGSNDYGMVVLSNESTQQGVVCADAVRFGGGMGNIARGEQVSGVCRAMEGARYWAQWAGMPYHIYSKSEGENDYNDDINCRSLMTNYLSGGSIFNPSEKGLKVPFELCLAIHSDAGYYEDNNLVGSLGIYTTDYNDGKTNNGISRYASRDFIDMILTGLQKDINSQFNIQWKRRSMWNRNYSETRLPAVPSAIIELLSHQNFNDLQLGHDPKFKFVVGRSIYKSILKYMANMHQTDYTVQPLPVNHFAIQEGEKKNTFELRWTPTTDPTEPTAKPDGYIVYTRIGDSGFDNGTYVRKNTFTAKIEPGLIYSFKITAVNKGGESFPSETLSAYKAKRSKGTILIVNAFHRTSKPTFINTPTEQGFDLHTDVGMPYLNTSAFCGYQQNFNRGKMGGESPEYLGFTDSSLEGKIIAGNTFDYPFVHGKAIQMADRFSFVSCSNETLVSGTTDLSLYPIVDIICGAEVNKLEDEIVQALTTYCNNNGCLLISGSNLNDVITNNDFCQQTLKFTSSPSMQSSYSGNIYGLNQSFSVLTQPNEQIYAVTKPTYILPAPQAFSTFLYTDNQASAGIAFKGNYRTLILGFPFECIQGKTQRAQIMKAFLNFFMEK